MHKLLFSVLFIVALAPFGDAQQFDFPAAAAQDPKTLSKVVVTLAGQVLAVYRDNDRETYFSNLSALQAVAGQYPQAVQSFVALRDFRRSAHVSNAAWLDLQYEIYVRARAVASAQNITFNDAYKQAFRDVFGHLDDSTSARAMPLFNIVDESWVNPALQTDLDAQKGKSTITLEEAVTLVRDYEAVQAYRDSAPLRPALIAEDDSRRYTIERDVQVETNDGATVCALTARSRASRGRHPALLLFTIYYDYADNLNDARLTAAHGYASVVGFTRGKACSPDKPVPYEHDGADAASLIDWITAQPWSDGRVGMYEGSYNGFTQWATAKYMPKGLKAMMTGAPAAPGIDVPMEGNVVWNFIYPWPFYTANGKGADDATYNDSKRWEKLNHNWYVSGRAYRDLDKIDGTANPIFDRWLEHPSYDAYWQSLIPYKEEFARINIPVLITIGYYAGGPGAGVYYFSQHEKYNPEAEHYLLIGPYGHIEAQYGPLGLLGNSLTSLSGLKLDPVAVLDLTDLRYQWFDYVFKNAPRPDLLQDRVNYEVTGANVWKHAPSLATMAGGMRRFYLGATKSGNAHALSEQKQPQDVSVDLRVNLADRTDADRKVPGGGVLDTELDNWNGIEFLSEPLTKPAELSGLFSGRLDFVANKKDFDFEIDLYELTPHGDYVQLASYWSRASYVGDRSNRRLLSAGKRQRLNFQSVRLMSRQLPQGSRVVAVVKVIKEPGREINYGTGKDVSAETIQDAKAPLDIHWYNDSYLDLPTGR
ncbi:MAG: CocE/NonD family hydrolase [Candidatus Acidiferrum sp.]|jgi:putative CocE/NonD family hydrolase